MVLEGDDQVEGGCGGWFVQGGDEVFEEGLGGAEEKDVFGGWRRHFSFGLGLEV